MKSLIKLSSFLILLVSSLLVATPSQATELFATVTVKTEVVSQPQTYHYWEVGKETVDALFPLSDDEVTEQYGHPKAVTQAKGSSEVSLSLAVGKRYYVRQVIQEGAEKMIVPFVIEPTEKELTVIAKYTEPKKTGDHHFIKVSSKGGNLEGAVFQVEKVTEKGQSEPVQTPAGIYQVTSGKDGRFKVTNVPYGRYLLRELKAPKGYLLLKEPVAFEVTATSGQESQALKVVNKPVTPPKIEIPYTGNLVMIVVIVIGFISFMIGWRMTRRD